MHPLYQGLLGISWPQQDTFPGGPHWPLIWPVRFLLKRFCLSLLTPFYLKKRSTFFLLDFKTLQISEVRAFSLFWIKSLSPDLVLFDKKKKVSITKNHTFHCSLYCDYITVLIFTIEVVYVKVSWPRCFLSSSQSAVYSLNFLKQKHFSIYRITILDKICQYLCSSKFQHLNNWATGPFLNLPEWLRMLEHLKSVELLSLSPSLFHFT